MVASTWTLMISASRPLAWTTCCAQHGGTTTQVAAVACALEQCSPGVDLGLVPCTMEQHCLHTGAVLHNGATLLGYLRSLA